MATCTICGKPDPSYVDPVPCCSYRCLRKWEKSGGTLKKETKTDPKSKVEPSKPTVTKTTEPVTKTETSAVAKTDPKPVGAAPVPITPQPSVPPITPQPAVPQVATGFDLLESLGVDESVEMYGLIADVDMDYDEQYEEITLIVRLMWEGQFLNVFASPSAFQHLTGYSVDEAVKVQSDAKKKNQPLDNAKRWRGIQIYLCELLRAPTHFSLERVGVVMGGGVAMGGKPFKLTTEALHSRFYVT